MKSVKLNNRGYMLVEIIVAAVLAFSIAFYLLHLTYHFKDVDEDIYYSTNLLTEQLLVTKNIMGDLEGKEITRIVTDRNYVQFEVQGGNIYKILIDENNTNIQYGLVDSLGNFKTKDSSYYIKKLSSDVDWAHVSIYMNTDAKYASIKIPVLNKYDDKNYDIKLFFYVSSV